jgi:CPA2 family monovalent cation:H+ antiporter-2
MLAGVGRGLGILPAAATQCLVAVSVVSITLNPILFRAAGPLSDWLSRFIASRDLPKQAIEQSSGPHRTIVIGYGPVGRTLTRLLSENGLEPIVVELNHETVQNLRERGIGAIYGDATQAHVLEQAGVRTAGALVFAASGSPEAVIRNARELNPKLLILTRANYVGEAPELKRIGAKVVVAAEAEVALAMTERLLTQLGATAEQLDRARERVRIELATE